MVNINLANKFKTTLQEFKTTGYAYCAKCEMHHSTWSIRKSDGVWGERLRCRKCERRRCKKYRDNHPEEQHAKVQRHRKQWPARYKIYTARKVARRRKFKCELTTATLGALLISQNYLCALTGRELSPDWKNITVDRVDSGQGYTIDNIQLVTIEANFCKQEYSMKDFIALCQDVVRTHGHQ